MVREVLAQNPSFFLLLILKIVSLLPSCVHFNTFTRHSHKVLICYTHVVFHLKIGNSLTKDYKCIF